VIRACRQPPNQPMGSQVRCGITFQALPADGESITALLRAAVVVASSYEARARLVIAIDGRESVECHRSQPSNIDTGTFTDPGEHPRMKTTPPPCTPRPIFDTEAVTREGMERNLQPVRESQKPGQKRLARRRLYVERKLGPRGPEARSAGLGINNLKQRHGGAARGTQIRSHR
jgi:hypothetical protein